MKTKDLIQGLWIVCQHANDLHADYKSILSQRENIKVIKEAIRRVKRLDGLTNIVKE